MLNSRLGRVAFLAMLLLVTIALAYFLGTAAGNFVSARKTESMRQEVTRGILKDMKNLVVGDTIPDHEFVDLNGHTVRLSEWLTAETLVTFFEPDCGSCIDEILRLRNTIDDTADYRRFIFVSAYSLDQLMEVRGKAGVPLRVLQDHDGTYAAHFGVYTFPFSLLVNKSRQVEGVITGIPSTEEYKRILKED